MNLDDLTLINMPVPCEQHRENIPESWSEIRVQCWRLLRVIIVKMCPLKYVIFYIQRNDHLAFSPFHLLPYFFFLWALSWYEPVSMSCVWGCRTCEGIRYILTVCWWWCTSCSALGSSTASFHQVEMESREFKTFIFRCCSYVKSVLLTFGISAHTHSSTSCNIETWENRSVFSWHMYIYPVYIYHLMYRAVSVFIDLSLYSFDFFLSLSTSRSNRHWNTRLDFPYWLFLTYLLKSLLKPPFLLCCVCVRVRVEVSGGKLPVIAFVRSWEWANAAVAVVTVLWWLSFPGLRDFGRAGFLWLIWLWSFVIKSFQLSCLLAWIFNYCSSRERHKLYFSLNIHLEMGNRWCLCFIFVRILPISIILFF